MTETSEFAVVHTIAEVREQVKAWKAQGLSVGLVPTMGFLHEGHRSLIERAVADNDRVVVSDFVNPVQFGPNEDLEAYPRDLDRDSKLVSGAGANLLFNPSPEEMYYPNRTTAITMATITEELCGKSRPVHFGGVCTVVAKLFNIVTPNRAYFGQKDAQQLLVIKRMVRDLNFDIEIIGCPIIREADGLAKSSRNTYLNAEQRAAAPILHKALEAGRELAESGEKSAEAIKAKVREVLATEPLADPEYVEVVDLENVHPVATLDQPVLVAIAVRIGKTRLIDNFFYPELH
ncbi:pantoate--beta-alanine ligase [Bifidobacterium sp. 82T24]|uniref:Pantothenate synthetase n=2 Tax=Bifidobacterium TaxID=1678 RepID=A0A2M9HAG5_9BIFI|nr:MULTISPECIES: pantoate--beta-alanine ligase [Bifidobacterium]MBW3088478.1 pantoate--beta-alanine ligase [Bifidobacterium pluvialisilvae]NEG96576.1 pantoate--beta-alanine ligase [Bifidobacterium sp. SMB2]NEH10507.1 pantoate--beta-alanine ligase [Bifidobacterium saimiriisciurei]NEH10710.1 pantoate--beta-alanine ligase [Bifidobacterium saimiriisciurei]PJM73806.1 pantoate--beta-alanine ligase [Bifidobacterium primatium]